MIEDGVNELVGPLSLDDLVVHEARLQAHADPLHEPRRRVIAGVAGADDPVPSNGVKPQNEHGFGCLGGETSPVVIRVEDESDLSLPVLPADQLQPDLAHHLPGLTPHHGEREPVALGAEAGLSRMTWYGWCHGDWSVL